MSDRNSYFKKTHFKDNFRLYSIFHLHGFFFLLFLKCFHFYKRSMEIVHFVQYFVVRYVIVVLMSLLSLFCWNVCMCLNNCCLVSDSNPSWVLKLFFDFISVHRGLLKIFINYIVHVLFSNYKNHSIFLVIFKFCV